MLTPKWLQKIVIESGILKQEDYKKYDAASLKEKLSLETYLIKNKIVPEETLYETIAKSLKIPFVKIPETIKGEILSLIPEPIAITHEIIAFDKTDDTLKVATLDPDDIQTFEFIKKKTGLEIKVHVTTPSKIKNALKLYHQSLEKEFETIAPKEESETGEKLKEIAEDLPVIRVVNTLLEYAIFEGASDIHIEPREKEISVRYRIDGILREVMTLPKTIQSGITARIKILANLKLDEHRLPQDGRFKIENKDYKISFRVSILPVFYGEKIVLRLLNEKLELLNLEDLGLTINNLQIINRNIIKPHGMILVTGPTGSGKTTTLYSILNKLNTPGVNITTIEDPIEYRVPNINQSQVNTKIGYTFANGLRSLLRQDPNIIMVGEIRDTETAEIAVQASMTGHLVLSTLHTNEAAAALPRLLDMSILPFLIASTVNVVIAQRLVRKICQRCIYSYNLEPEIIKELKKQFDIERILKGLEEEGVITSSKEQPLESLLFFKGKGCRQCGDTGYKGRIGIYEALELTPQIAELILKKVSTEQIRQKAMVEGMLTMLQDGFIKAKKGITTIEEILRVTKE